MTAQQPLVTYARPPLTEVVIGVQFERLDKLDAAHLGLLWDKFRSRFPRTEQKPPLDSAIERVGLRGPLAEPRLELLTEFRQRLWFLSDTGDELVQVQDDRFIRNWRRQPGEHSLYPRFGELEPRFIDDMAVFTAFLEAEKLGSVDANQCEVTYVNIIARTDHWSSHSDLSKVFRGWSSEFATAVDWPMEAVQARTAHILNDARGEFVGRLHVAIEPAFAAPVGTSAEPVFRLVLTARGRPLGPGMSGIQAFLDLGHRAVVMSFDKMVTVDMQSAWGRV